MVDSLARMQRRATERSIFNPQSTTIRQSKIHNQRLVSGGSMKICLAGTGAMGEVHVKALAKIDDVQVVSIAARTDESAKAFAEKYNIPFGSSNLEARDMVAAAKKAGKVCMVTHTRRFSSPHREIRRRIWDGTFHLHHMVVETYFFRRTNTN